MSIPAGDPPRCRRTPARARRLAALRRALAGPEPRNASVKGTEPSHGRYKFVVSGSNPTFLSVRGPFGRCGSMRPLNPNRLCPLDLPENRSHRAVWHSGCLALPYRAGSRARTERSEGPRVRVVRAKTGAGRRCGRGDAGDDVCHRGVRPGLGSPRTSQRDRADVGRTRRGPEGPVDRIDGGALRDRIAAQRADGDQPPRISRLRQRHAVPAPRIAGAGVGPARSWRRPRRMGSTRPRRRLSRLPVRRAGEGRTAGPRRRAPGVFSRLFHGTSGAGTNRRSGSICGPRTSAGRRSSGREIPAWRPRRLRSGWCRSPARNSGFSSCCPSTTDRHRPWSSDGRA